MQGREMPVRNREILFQEIFRRYHRAEFISPDPLEFLYRYEDPRDQEIVGLLASSLAYGRVSQIIRSVDGVLKKIGSSPRVFLDVADEAVLRDTFRGFKHRFTTDSELVDLLLGIQGAIRRYGSLKACFLAGMSQGDETTIPALSAFTREINIRTAEQYSSLIPQPTKKSACKRLHLFLRWMIRSDVIDPGVWTGVSPAKLIIPLDTHMHRICGLLGMTSRTQADMKTAQEITEGFRKISPEDPVRYDFALTRLGILREDMALSDILEKYAHPPDVRAH
jgi:uncharacterized protein (TIGR02757 family)